MFELQAIERMEKVIAMAIAPSFLIGGITALIAVMIARFNNVIDRSRSLHTIDESDGQRGHLRTDIPRLMHRAVLINRTIMLLIGSALALTLLVLLSFIAAFSGFQHVPGAALLFTIALCLLAAALITFALEVNKALNPLDYHP